MELILPFIDFLGGEAAEQLREETFFFVFSVKSVALLLNLELIVEH
jgi:hypothetical protein